MRQVAYSFSISCLAIISPAAVSMSAPSYDAMKSNGIPSTKSYSFLFVRAVTNPIKIPLLWHCCNIRLVSGSIIFLSDNAVPSKSKSIIFIQPYPPVSFS